MVEMPNIDNFKKYGPNGEEFIDTAAYNAAVAMAQAQQKAEDELAKAAKSVGGDKIIKAVSSVGQKINGLSEAVTSGSGAVSKAYNAAKAFRAQNIATHIRGGKR